MDIKRRYRFLIIFLSPFLVLSSQVPDQNAFDNWYRLINVKISPNGKWNLFYKLYDSGKREAVLLNTSTKRMSVYEEPVDFYLDNGRFFLLTKDEKLQMKNLISSQNKSLEKMTKFHYFKTMEKTLIVGKQQLTVLDKDQKIILSLEGVERISSKKDSPFVLFEKDHRPTILDIDNTQLFSLPVDLAVSKIVYSVSGTDQMSVLVSKNEKLSLFTLKKGVLTEKTLPINYEKDMQFEISRDNILTVSRPYLPDQDTVESLIEVWDSSDSALFPKIERYKNHAKTVGLIDLKSNQIIREKLVSNENRRLELFSENLALWVSDLVHESFYRNNVSVLPSLQLVDLKTQEILLKVDQVNLYYVLKEKNALLYFSDKNWWIYNTLTHKNLNITASLGTDFYHYDRLNTRFPFPCAKAFFTDGLSKIYLTDGQDIWEYDVTKERSTKITKATPDIRYKIINSSAGGSLTTFVERPSVISGNQLILEVNTMDDRKKGLSVWKNHKMINIIEPTPQNIDYVQSNENMVSFTQENANAPQKLFRYHLLTRHLEPIFESNAETFSPAHFPHSVIVEWKDSSDFLTAALVVLPPHYDRNKKYPVITNIYENKVKEYLHFTPPSFYNGDGFNRTLMALQDYIVILPQIYYTTDEVGESAKKSVEEAIIKVSEKYALDFDHLGLIGHSFGGYETNYIMTHSTMFSTAISGSSLSDITADYFTVHEQFLQSNISRYTNGTFRFSEDFYKNKDVYFQNNPVFSADSVLAPMLLWTGKQDHHVNWRQSISMYMALASQNKTVKLLLFKNEAHALMQRDNQLMATRYFINWFDHYLKGKSLTMK